MPGRYEELLGKLRIMLQASGCTEEEFNQIADDASRIATGVFYPVDFIIASGNKQNLDDTTDLMLIGAIVARYGMVMGNPFAGKE